MLCKCGNPSKGTDLVMYYKRRDGTMSKYVQKEKRCQKCINTATKIANRKIRRRQKAEKEQAIIGY